LKDSTNGKEVILTEAYIDGFKISNPKEFERLNQINRRTEGKIIGMDFDPSVEAPFNLDYFIKIK
jgi:hypothetical protein